MTAPDYSHIRPPDPVFPVPPTPLSKATAPPPFPSQALGGWAAEMVQAVAEATQTDPGGWPGRWSSAHWPPPPEGAPRWRSARDGGSR